MKVNENDIIQAISNKEYDLAIQQTEKYSDKKAINNDIFKSLVIGLINIKKGNVKIVGFDDILNTFQLQDYIEVEDNFIIIKSALKDYVGTLVSNGAMLFQLFKQINPFVNLLKSYDDQYIFTIFFSEPTYIRATQGAETEISPLKSQLSKLLLEFKKKIANDKIDDYDILSHWMDFILKNYYEISGDN